MSPKVDKNKVENNNGLRQVLEYQIHYLQYLINLQDERFDLWFISEEGIWFGTKLLESEPTEELSKLLIPP